MAFLGAMGDANALGMNKMIPALAGGALGAAGGAAGSQSNQTMNTQRVANLTPFGQAGQRGYENAFNNYQGLAQSATPYTQGGPAEYARMLQQYSQNGGMPNQQQIGYANQYAQNIFAPQQAQLNNVFQQAQVNNDRQAAAMGRSVNDPILAAKLAQYQGQQQGILGGQQAALSAQVGMQLPGQQLGYAQALSNAAFQNQSNVLGLGQGILQNQQTWALNNAPMTQTVTGTQGGGLQGGILGAFGGMQGGLNLMNSFFGNKTPGGGSGGAGGLAGDSGYGIGSVGDIAGAGNGVATAGEAGSWVGDFGSVASDAAIFA